MQVFIQLTVSYIAKMRMCIDQTELNVFFFAYALIILRIIKPTRVRKRKLHEHINVNERGNIATHSRFRETRMGKLEKQLH